ncbi:MAG: prepilin peptidase [Candidatus Micrarchaeota archaeon]|nr:prepilin peptidase [Candidatus Micrarchaeota archaeon]
MNYELIRIAAVLLGTGAAAWQDHKTSFIDDRIVYAMMGLGLLLDLLTMNQDFIIYSVGIAAAIIGFGYLFYRTGQLGGGDVLLFAGIQLLLPYYPSTVSPGFAPTGFLFIPFLVSVLAASSLYALLGTSVKYGLELRKRKLAPDLPSAGAAALLFAAMFYFMAAMGTGTLFAGLLLLIFVPGAFLMVFKKQITDEIIIKRIRISQVEDEDVLATEKMPAAILKKYGLGRVLTKKEVEKLRKIEKREGMRLFPVYKNLPRFGPYILAGLITCLVVGDVFIFIALASFARGF